MSKFDAEASVKDVMPVYQLVITRADGRQHTLTTEFADDAAAIADAAGALTEEHPIIAVARGAGADAQFLGAWDWVEGEAQWTPEE